MKKLFCALCLLLFLTVSVSAFAESFIVPTEDEEILLMMNRIALASTFSYEKLWYYKPTNSICMDFAEDGFASAVLEMLERGYDETYKPWAEFKEVMFQTYQSIVDFCADSGRYDVDVSLSFVNDDIYMRNDDSNLSATTFLSFRNGEVWFDLLHELSMFDTYFGE